MRFRLIYPRFRKFLDGHDALKGLVRDHLVGDYTMPPSLALPIIAALTPADIEVNLTDDNIGQEIDYDEKVDLVVLSCFTPQAQRAYEIADEFRKRGTRVIIGGMHPTGIPDEAAGHADAVCVGEVEPVWAEVLEDLRNGGLKRLYQCHAPHPVAQLPIPKREIFSRDTYTWDAHLVMTTRGCPVRCESCPIPDKEGTILRLRPVESVVEEIRAMDYRQFYFTDDTVMLPGKKNMKYLLALMERTGELDVNIFLASTMMMVSDRSFYQKLKAGGTESIYTVFGFDRVSRQLFGRNCTKELWRHCVDLVRMIEESGIHFFGSYGIGFDDQDKDVFEKILRFCDEAKVDLAEFYISTPFPGTPFGRKATRENRILHKDYHLWNTGNVVFRPLHFTADQILEGFYSLWSTFYRHKDPKETLRTFQIQATSPASGA